MNPENSRMASSNAHIGLAWKAWSSHTLPHVPGLFTWPTFLFCKLVVMSLIFKNILFMDKEGAFMCLPSIDILGRGEKNEGQGLFPSDKSKICGKLILVAKLELYHYG